MRTSRKRRTNFPSDRDCKFDEYAACGRFFYARGGFEVTADLLALAGQFGAPGLFIAFLIWDRREQAAAAKDRAKADQDIAEKRVQADLDMAKSLTMLAERINHVR